MAVANVSTIEVNTFGFELLRKLITASPGQSLAISPFSLAHCLILAAMRSEPDDAKVIYRLLNCHWFPVEQIENWFSQRYQQFLDSTCTSMASACWADYEFPSEPDIEKRQQFLGASEQSLNVSRGSKSGKNINRGRCCSDSIVFPY
ncbi:MAG: serpin family protein [Armatimonas sp.]